MLSTYLHAAKNVVQTKQARPGVAVHVRLGGDDSDGGDKQGGSAANRTGVTSSYAVWAVTGGCVCRLVRLRSAPKVCSRISCVEVCTSEAACVCCLRTGYFRHSIYSTEL